MYKKCKEFHQNSVIKYIWFFSVYLRICFYAINRPKLWPKSFNASFLTFPCFLNPNNMYLKQVGGIFVGILIFAFWPNFLDLLTSSDLIIISICIMFIWCDTSFINKQLDGCFVVLWLIPLKIKTFLLTLPLTFDSQKEVEGLVLWRHFLTYCRVTKILPEFFWCTR